MAVDASDVHILVVEDDQTTREITIDILSTCGYKVHAAIHGQAGLDMLQRLEVSGESVDLILCDVMMPVMDGLSFLMAVQERENLRHIPVVMTSGNEEMSVVTSCLAAGAKDYLIKPVLINSAKTLIRHVWQSRIKSANQISMHSPMDFTILRPLGKGTHGTVMLARRKGDGKLVALKQIHRALLSQSEKRRAENEVTLLKVLRHINIVRYYDSFEDEDELNIIMEYAEGGTLRERVLNQIKNHQGTYFSEATILYWFAQLVLAIAYIHGKNVLHRDLKAGNVFLTHSNIVKLGDFGISRALADNALANTACGTPESMSPEICRGQPYGKKSDIWALGCILYEMVMLRRPFEEKNLSDMFGRIIQGRYPPVRESASLEIRLLISLMLQTDPDKRPPIEDIFKFSVIQGPVIQFLTEHSVELQQALEEDARITAHPATSSVLKSVGQDAMMLDSNNSSFASEGGKYLHTLTPSYATPSYAYTQPSTVSMASVREEGRTSSASEARGLDLREQAILAATEGLNDQTDWRDALAERLRNTVSVEDRRAGLFRFFNQSAVGSELVDAIANEGGKERDTAAIEVHELVKAGLLIPLGQEIESHLIIDSPQAFFRFRVDEPNLAMNERFVWRKGTRPAIDVSCSIRQQIAELHRHTEFPPGVLQTEAYSIFARNTAELCQVDLSKMLKPAKPAFFLNLYNTMVLHGLIVYGVPKTSEQYRNFNRLVVYNVGGYMLSLADIRHGVLRRNRKPPNSWFARQFTTEDPRLKHCRVHFRDPRWLLALIEPCRPIPSPGDLPVFKTQGLDAALERVCQQFCAKYVRTDPLRRQVHLPKLFRLYRDDFGSTDEEMVSWLMQYVREDLREEGPDVRIVYNENTIIS